MPSVSDLAQRPDADALVTLYVLDATTQGGELLRFVAGTLDGARPSFQGQEFQPLPIEAEGFAWTGRGAPPRPRLRVANIGGVLGGLLGPGGDLLGATLTRLRTFRRFLDGEPDADPTLAGVAGLLSPQPRAANFGATERAESYLLSGPTNSGGQGLPVPLIYGRCRVGSVLASAGISVEDLRSSSDVPVVPGSALGVTGWGQT